MCGEPSDYGRWLDPAFHGGNSVYLPPLIASGSGRKLPDGFDASTLYTSSRNGYKPLWPKDAPPLNLPIKTTSVCTFHLDLAAIIARRSRQLVRDSHARSKSTHVIGRGVVQAGAVSAIFSKSAS